VIDLSVIAATAATRAGRAEAPNHAVAIVIPPGGGVSSAADSASCVRTQLISAPRGPPCVIS
jgi:hypothetical protein